MCGREGRGTGVRLWKGNGNKSIAKRDIFFRSLINSNVTAAFIWGEKALDFSKSLSNRTCLIIILNYLKFER